MASIQTLGSLISILNHRETKTLRNPGVPFDHIIDEETETLEGKYLVFESFDVWGTQDKNVLV